MTTKTLDLPAVGFISTASYVLPSRWLSATATLGFGKSLLGIQPHEINQAGVSRVFQQSLKLRQVQLSTIHGFLKAVPCL